MLVLSDDSIEEGHGWADPGHFILIVFQSPVIPRVRCSARIPEWVDQRVQGLPDWDQSPRVRCHKDGLFFAQEMRED